MKAKLKYIHSPDIPDLPAFVPQNQDSFSILLQLMVSPFDGEGEESFDLILCTPKWLMENHKISDIIIGRHYLIVFEYNYPGIYNKLKRIIENIDEKNWDEIGLKIGRIGKWEFEDYQEK